MTRAPFGHVSRRCVRCGEVGPRTMIDGGWAHSRCITPDERKAAHRRVLALIRTKGGDAESPSGEFLRRAPSVTPDHVGTALGYQGDTKVRLHSLNVTPAHRRTGLAGMTLQRFADLADETGVSITAEVWTREQGDDAIPQGTLTALFAWHGFIPTGIGHTMRREPARTTTND